MKVRVKSVPRPPVVWVATRITTCPSYRSRTQFTKVISVRRKSTSHSYWQSRKTRSASPCAAGPGGGGPGGGAWGSCTRAAVVASASRCRNMGTVLRGDRAARGGAAVRREATVEQLEHEASRGAGRYQLGCRRRPECLPWEVRG